MSQGSAKAPQVWRQPMGFAWWCRTLLCLLLFLPWLRGTLVQAVIQFICRAVVTARARHITIHNCFRIRLSKYNYAAESISCRDESGPPLSYCFRLWLKAKVWCIVFISRFNSFSHNNVQPLKEVLFFKEGAIKICSSWARKSLSSAKGMQCPAVTTGGDGQSHS